MKRPQQTEEKRKRFMSCWHGRFITASFTVEIHFTKIAQLLFKLLFTRFIYGVLELFPSITTETSYKCGDLVIWRQSLICMRLLLPFTNSNDANSWAFIFVIDWSSQHLSTLKLNEIPAVNPTKYVGINRILLIELWKNNFFF